MTLGAYFKVLRKRWRTVAITTAVVFVLAAIVTVLLPKQYVAESTSFVSISSNGKADDTSNNLNAGSQYALNQVQSYPAMATSTQVLKPVIDSLDLDMSVGELKSKVTATNPVDTVLLTIKVSDGSSRQAMRIANAIADRLGAYVQTLETPTDATASPVKVTTAIPATKPGAPSSPRPMLNLVLGLILGLALGSILAAVRERRDTSVKTLDDLRRLTGASPLGAVRYQSSIIRQPLVATGAGVILEDFRSIRTNLRYTDVDHGTPRQFVVSSAMPGEGKSVVSCNIAIVMAQTGLRVCLVEADLRKPKVTDYLGVDSAVGLTQVSAGEFELDDVLVSWNRGMLTVLPSGPTPPDPTQLLGSQSTAQLLEELRSRFDVVVIDGPPLLPVSDSAVLGAESDGVILVARHGTVTREQVADALDQLDAVGAKLIGTVLNGGPAKDQRSSYGAGYATQPQDLAPASSSADRPATRTAAQPDAPADQPVEAPSSVATETRSAKGSQTNQAQTNQTRTNQGRSGQGRSNQARSNQARSGQARSGSTKKGRPSGNGKSASGGPVKPPARD